ncbi:MAG: hypothetical protein LBR80_12780 [Deltaproteobacteria bacterium]|jgi:hypothetical protein|nr:hypothetical protein [Deltaproteobacteria bacterium]
MPGVLMEKVKLLELIQNEIHTEYIIVEEDQGILTIEPYNGIVPETEKVGLMDEVKNYQTD